MISIFDYTDYSHFLRAYYTYEKSQKPYFSYQYLADKCGFKSKSYLYKVIKGDKALNVSSALRIAAFMKLKKKETDYFEAIVQFTNSKQNSEKEFYFRKLQTFSKNSEQALIRKHQFEYFKNWYNCAIRELATIIDWKDDYAYLAKQIVPHITPSEAKQSVELLCELGFIQRTESGRYERCNAIVSTGPDVISLAVNKFQKKNLQLASEAIDRFPRPERDISTLTVSVNQEGVDRISKEIAECRKRILDLISQYSEVDKVYQVNFQSFPLSKSAKDHK